LGKTSQGAREEFYPYYSRYFSQGGAPFAANGFPREANDSWIAQGLPVGSPQQVIDAIMRRVELTGIDLFIGQIDVGDPPVLHGAVRASNVPQAAAKSGGQRYQGSA
jgi:hypothetical protein